MHGWVLIVTIVIGTRPQVGFVFDPREKIFLCGPAMAASLLRFMTL